MAGRKDGHFFGGNLNYYQFHIGDYLSATAHLSPMEDIAYRRLIDLYYDTEKPISLETDKVSRRLRLGLEVIESVLSEFFVKTENGWFNHRCDADIRAYHVKADLARINGKLGGRPKKTNAVIFDNPDVTQKKANQEPRTINQEPILKSYAPASRLPADWKPSKDEIEFCKTKRPDLNPFDVADAFVDYWISVPGAKGRKANWTATWRNWVRNQKMNGSNQLKGNTRHEQLADKLADLTGRKRKAESIDQGTINGTAERLD